MRTTSLRLRTVVAVLVLLAVLLAGLVVAVEAVLGARLRAQVEDRLRDRAAAAAALVGVLDADDLADRLSAQGLSVRIVQSDGAAVEAGPTPDQLRSGPPDPAGLPGPAARERSSGGSSSPGSSAPGSSDPGSSSAGSTRSGAGATTTSGASVVSADVRDDDGVLTLRSVLDDGTRITLTAGTRDVQETLAQLGWVMGGASAAFLGVAVVGVVLVVRRALRPLDEVTATARSIADGDRGRRLRPARTDTEIGRVAAAFDEMLDAVEGAEAQAVAAEERVRGFLSDAAHELRTPVAGVRAAADTLVRSGGDDPATTEVLAVHVVRQADRAARLVDDMLTMARLDRGIALDRRPTDLVAWLRAEVDRLGLRLPGTALRPELPSGPVRADVDPDRLAQVLANLVDNAARATGGTGTVRLSLAADGDGAVLEVEDDGPGIPLGDRERVFDRLVRLEDARDVRSGGAGLGLPIARGIAVAHGGTLVHGDDGTLGGARFVLRLPRTCRSVEPGSAAGRGVDRAPVSATMEA
ncbi:sensor histidine kinase [Curtobacterium caseinilyticum]|uniref:histidine kinase n=1 Tax=Curtobacterium caseinilyticum TaxID=3055137 RepID=A0ABT7TL33_9MICO|nr:HAMP domain-containing sensor histidine kinase [Curtobacterium caseinilyticum]MDM7890302.1 HAMP domain-containing sensor histidine kinase [Curtobacterium caseinilyticum]